MTYGRTLKTLGVLALTSITLAGSASAGERSPGLMGPGVAVGPYTNNIAVMQGYQQRRTIQQIYQLQVPASNLHKKCPDGYFWKGHRCAPLFNGVRVGR